MGRNSGLQTIREFGLTDFPDAYDDYYLVDGGVVAVGPCRFGGKELHIAFNEPHKARLSIPKLCDFLGGTWWAIIRTNRKSVINSCLKVGFTLEKRFNGFSIVDNVEREYIALKRG